MRKSITRLINGLLLQLPTKKVYQLRLWLQNMASLLMPCTRSLEDTKARSAASHNLAEEASSSLMTDIFDGFSER